MTNQSQLFSFALAFIVSTIGGILSTYVVRGVARRTGWATRRSGHHIHRRAIPRLGGVAIYGTFISFFAVAASTRIGLSWRQALPVVLPASLLFLVGIVDDFRNLSARLKLGVQVIGGMWLFANGVRLLGPAVLEIKFWGWDLEPVVSFVATIGWVILITNALNLIDGLDGLAAGSALFSIIPLLGLAWAGHNTPVAFSALILGGAVLGFLRYNFNAATIFLGDGGSLFLGFMLAGLAMQSEPAAAPASAAVTVLLISFGLPVFETVVSILRRFLSGKPLFSPDKDHIHHRLLQRGLSQRQAVIALYGICAACALLSLCLLWLGRSFVILILVSTVAMFCMVIQRLDYAEFREFTRFASRIREQRDKIAKNVVISKTARTVNHSKSWPEVNKALEMLLEIAEFDSYVLMPTGGPVLRGEANKVVLRDPVHMNKTNGNGSGNGRPSHKPAAWTVTLDLKDRHASQTIGQFVMGSFRGRSLTIDLNLILIELQPALSSACERLSSHEYEVLEDEDVPILSLKTDDSQLLNRSAVLHCSD